MYRFENPKYFYLFIFVAFVALIYFVCPRQKNNCKYSEIDLVNKLLVDNSKIKGKLKFLIVIVSFALIILSMKIFKLPET